MARFSYVDKSLVEKIFVHGGYVLDFSDRTFAEFFDSEVGVNIDDPVYRTKGTSKGNRLRTFLGATDDATAGRALAALWTYERTLSSRTTDMDDVGRMTALVQRLKSPPPLPSTVPAGEWSTEHEAATISALASYAHQGETYDRRVLESVKRLRRDGIDAISDHLVDFPTEGWPAWMDRELTERRFILVFASERYQRCAEGKEEAGYGLGVIWEHGTIRRALYKAGRINERFLPVGFGPDQRKFVPDSLHDYTYFDLDSPTDYEKLLRVMRGTPHPLSSEKSSTPPIITPTLGAIALAYQAEDELDADCFAGWIPATNGRFSMMMRPASYDAERITRARLAGALGTIRVQTNGSSDAFVMPFAQNTNVRGFGSGRGMEGTLIDPHSRRIEYMRIHRSGQYRIVRIFAEDYGDDNMLKFDKLELWNDDFIRRVTILFLLAARGASSIGLASSDAIELNVAITGLGNRRVVSYSIPPSVLEETLLSKATTGFDPISKKHLILTRDELERDGVQIARELVTDVYWNFGLTDPTVEDYVGIVQRDQLGRAP